MLETFLGSPPRSWSKKKRSLNEDDRKFLHAAMKENRYANGSARASGSIFAQSLAAHRSPFGEIRSGFVFLANGCPDGKCAFTKFGT